MRISIRIIRLTLPILLSGAMLSCAQKMGTQPGHKPLDGTELRADGGAIRDGQPGTMRSHFGVDGKIVVQDPPVDISSDTTPFPLTRELLSRGRERFEINCAVCHGLAGYGDGMIVQRGFLRSPSFHDQRLRDAPIGHFYDVMTHGFGAMARYSDQVEFQDRWAIAAYIRALQISQNATLANLPSDEAAKLEATK